VLHRVKVAGGLRDYFRIQIELIDLFHHIRELLAKNDKNEYKYFPINYQPKAASFLLV